MAISITELRIRITELAFHTLYGFKKEKFPFFKAVAGLAGNKQSLAPVLGYRGSVVTTVCSPPAEVAGATYPQSLLRRTMLVSRYYCVASELKR